MKRSAHITAFYVETLLMIVVMAVILMVMTGVFGYSRANSVRAKHLTEAVTVAQNTAEALTFADDLEACTAYLPLEDSSLTTEADGSEVLTGYYKWVRAAAPEEESVYRVEITRAMPVDSMCASSIAVYYDREEKPVYELETSRYLPGEEAGT